MTNLLFAIRHRMLRDYLQWIITGTSPRTRPVDIAARLAAMPKRPFG